MSKRYKSNQRYKRSSIRNKNDKLSKRTGKRRKKELRISREEKRREEKRREEKRREEKRREEKRKLIPGKARGK